MSALENARRTAHQLAAARHAGTARRRGGRMVRQLPPDAIRRDYAATILAVLALHRPTWDDLLSELAVAVGEGADRADARADAAPGDAAKVRRAVARARKAMAGTVSTAAIEKMARKFAAQVETHQRVQLGRQVHQALGVSVAASDAGVPPIIDNFAHTNAALIESVSQQAVDAAERLALHAVQTGRRWEDVADDLREQYNVSENRAKLIARDQVGKLVADVDQERQRALGVRKFVWRCLEDELVRGRPDGKYPRAKTSHWALRNRTFTYDDPPENDDGEKILPGDEPLCRCYAEPDFDDLLDVAGGDTSGYDERGGDGEDD